MSVNTVRSRVIAVPNRIGSSIAINTAEPMTVMKPDARADVHCMNALRSCEVSLLTRLSRSPESR